MRRVYTQATGVGRSPDDRLDRALARLAEGLVRDDEKRRIAARLFAEPAPKPKPEPER